MTPQIIDISSNNGVVDFHKVFASGMKRVIIRASLGYGDMDGQFSTYTTNAKNAGMSISFYHVAYIHPEAAVLNDSANQANYFVENYRKTGITPEYLVLDIETPTTISKTACELWIKTFCDTVKAHTGIDVIIYSYKSWLDTHLNNTHKLGIHRLWIANYNAGLTTPPLPLGWKTYFMWQYNEKGSVAGITGNVDLSIFHP